MNIRPTLPPSATTPPSKAKITPSSQTGEGNLSVTKSAQAPRYQPVIERRKKKDRRKAQQKILIDLRSGRERRRSQEDGSSIDINA